MRKFDTKIQYLKYKVLREVARYGFEDNLDAAYYEIPKLIVKEKPTMRCCIYKERAIVEERIKLAMGGDKKNPNVIEVIRDCLRRMPGQRPCRHRVLPRLSCTPLRGRMPPRRHHV